MTSPSDRAPTSNGYMPIKALAYWDVIGAFVTDAVDEAAAATGRSPRSLYPATCAFVLWAWQTRGTPLERDRVFRAPVIDAFVHRGMEGYTNGSKATHRATLTAVADLLNPNGLPPRRRPLPRSIPTPPYTAADVQALASWAAAQGTTRRRHDAQALLSLGLGAGLATRELLGVRAGDIDTRTGQLEVIVWESRPRVVPVSADWLAPLHELLEGTPPDSWLFRAGRTGIHPGQITDFLQRARTTLDVRPSRMRTTWLLKHLAEGTPPQELLRYSGLKNLAALDKITVFAPRTRHRDETDGSA